MNEENIIYIFDFDDTLAKTIVQVDIIDNETNEVLQELKPSYFMECYKLQPNEHAVFIDSDDYIKLPIMNTLKEAVSRFEEKSPKHICLCTARHSTSYPYKVLEREGIKNVPVYAVGKKQYNGDISYHARRKKAFVSAVIRKHKPSTIFFYDDSLLNLAAVGSLAKKYKTKIILVNSNDHSIEILEGN